MKVCAISDLHGHLPEIPPCDLLLIAGDICPVKNHHSSYQSKWFASIFTQWLCRVQAESGCRAIVGTLGNHDFVGERFPGLVRGLPWTYLQNEVCEFEGLKIWGSPWTLEFNNWAFNMTKEELRDLHQWIPDVDIIVTHSPVYGYGDYSIYNNEHCGCPTLLERIVEMKPKLAVYGHIHSGRGDWTLTWRNEKKTTLANVSLVDEQYQMVYNPMVFEI